MASLSSIIAKNSLTMSKKGFKGIATSVTSKIFVYLLMTLYAIFLLLPLFFTLMSSIRPSNEIFQYVYPFSLSTFIPKQVTLDSYVSLFVNFDFGRPLWNTIYVCVATMVVGLTLNPLAGFAFAKFHFRSKPIWFAITLVTMMIPFEAIAIPMYSMVNQLNMINTHSALIWPAVANGMYIFLFRQYFEEVPDSLAESARIDGANWMQIFLKIYLPLTKSVMISAGLLIFFYQWQSYLWPLLAVNAPNVRVIQVALTVFKQEHDMLWGEMFAASALTTIIPLLAFFPFQKYYKLGISTSGMKE